MNVAEERYDTRVLELERFPLTLRPSAEVMTELLVAIDGRPEDVVGNAVAVEKFDGRALLNRHNVRHKHQAFLVDGDVLCGRREGFAGNTFNVDNGFPFDSGNLAVKGAGDGCRVEGGYRGKHYENMSIHKFSW